MSGDPLSALVEDLYQELGVDYRGYVRSTLEQRISKCLEAEGIDTVSELRESVFRDDRIRGRLLEGLSIRPTLLFHRPPFFRVVRERLVPMLRTYPFVNLWHPNCSTGEHVYATAIVLREEGILERTRIYATDVNESVLARARAGIYSRESVEQSATRYLQAGGKSSLEEYYTIVDDKAAMRPLLRERIVFAQHSLASDASFNEFHLIICQNVLSDFTPELTTRVFGLLHESICRFGILGLGQGESLRGSLHANAYEEFCAENKLYRRVS